MNTTLDIVYILNDKYWIPVLVSAKSAILCRSVNSSDGVKLRFHLLVDGVLPVHLSRLCSELTTIVSTVHIVNIDMGLFSDMPEWHGSKLVWTRCKINRFLPDLSNWICVCDGDTLWLRDPLQLFKESEKFPENIILGCSIDYVSKDTKSSDWFTERGLYCPDSEYGCMGFALLRLAKLKEFNFENKAIEFISEFGIPPWFEQDIFNFLLRGYKMSLPLGWGGSPIRGLGFAGQDAMSVIHYYGALPWPVSFSRRMLDVHVPWWFLATKLLHIPKEEKFEMTALKLICMRCMTQILQFVPNSVLNRFTHSAKQVPFNYHKVTAIFKEGYKYLER